MLSGARITLEGKVYNLVITDEALGRIAAAGFDLWSPPLRCQQPALDEFLLGVFSASAHIETGDEMRWAGLSSSDTLEILSPYQGEELFAAVNQALADYWRRKHAMKPRQPNGGEWN